MQIKWLQLLVATSVAWVSSAFAGYGLNPLWRCGSQQSDLRKCRFAVPVHADAPYSPSRIHGSGDLPQSQRQGYGHPLEVRHYGKRPGSFELYEDDGKTFGYEKGACALRSFHFADGRGTEAIIKSGQQLFGPVERWVEMTK